MTDPVLDAVRATAVTAARAAGALQRAGRVRGVDVHVHAKGAADIATDVDIACEQRITEIVTARHPAHGLVGEEGSHHRADAPWQWLVDPLDGTKNYAHGSLRCAVSLAVSHHGTVQVAVVYAPFVDELYVATLGGGATCNDVPIRVSRTDGLRAAMVASALTYAGRNALEAQTARVLRVFSAVQAVRSLGCAALDLCDVARGRLDGYFEPGLAPWDTAAGALMVTEAGGTVTTFTGQAHSPGAPDMLATNGALHGALQDLMGGRL